MLHTTGMYVHVIVYQLNIIYVVHIDLTKMRFQLSTTFSQYHFHAIFPILCCVRIEFKSTAL